MPSTRRSGLPSSSNSQNAQVAAVDKFKLGTHVHALMPGGNCVFGLITRWDPARQLADLAVFPSGPRQEGLDSAMRYPNEFAHREQPRPSDELTFHLAEACPWNR